MRTRLYCRNGQDASSAHPGIEIISARALFPGNFLRLASHQFICKSRRSLHFVCTPTGGLTGLQCEVREIDLDVILGLGFNREARRVESILPGWQLDDHWGE
jgi:hypothetical protein